jgi:putative FmdB family regulatory protein
VPTYEYACDACGATWELEQRISESPIRKCTTCGKHKAHRLISQGNFLLKGGGWYSDLYSGPSNKKAAGASSPEKQSSEGAKTPEKTSESSGSDKAKPSSDAKTSDTPSKKKGE